MSYRIKATERAVRLAIAIIQVASAIGLGLGNLNPPGLSELVSQIPVVGESISAVLPQP